MEKHITVDKQIENLVNQKNICDADSDAVRIFLNETPYGLSIQQVKFFFKILTYENRIKNYIFYKSYQSTEVKEYALNVTNNANGVNLDSYYKLINTASTGELIKIIKYVYLNIDSEIFNIKKQDKFSTSQIKKSYIG